MRDRTRFEVERGSGLKTGGGGGASRRVALMVKSLNLVRVVSYRDHIRTLEHEERPIRTVCPQSREIEKAFRDSRQRNFPWSFWKWVEKTIHEDKH